MLFVISLVFLFLTRLRFPSKLSIAEVLRKRYGDRILKLVRKFEKTENYKLPFEIRYHNITLK